MEKACSDYNKICVNDVLFVMAYGLFIISMLLDSTVITHEAMRDATLIRMLNKLMRYGAYFLCIVKMLMQARYKNKQIIILIGAIITLLASYVGSGNKTMVLYVLLFVAAIGISYDTIIKTAALTQAIVVLTFVIGSQLGIFVDYVRDDGDRVRHFLGFSWTTTSAIIFLFVLLQYIYLKQGQLTWFEGLAFAIASTYFFVMTDSRFAFLVCVATIIFFLLFKKIVSKGTILKNCRWLVVAAPWIIAIFAIVLHVAYDPGNPVMYKLNDLLSGRLRLGQSAINTYGFSLIGKEIEWIGYSISEELKGVYNYVDCSYVQLTLEHGLMFLGLILVVYSVILYRAILSKRYYLGWIVLIILLFSISEPRLFNLTYNPFVLLVLARDGGYEQG